MKEKYYKLSNNLIEYSRRSKILEKDEEYSHIIKWRDYQDQRVLQKTILQISQQEKEFFV